MSVFTGRFRRFLRTGLRPRKPRRPERASLAVEALECRLVPTVLFQPLYNNESASDGGADKLSNGIPVYLIFWGQYWQAPDAGNPTVGDLTTAAGRLLSGPYFKGLQEYGIGGQPVLSGEYKDPNNPGLNGLDDGQMSDVLSYAKDHGMSDLDNAIYVIFTQPGVSARNNSTAASYNTVIDDNTVAWVGAGGFGHGGLTPRGLPGNASLLDEYTVLFSHEVAEAISRGIDSEDGNDGITVTQGSTWPIQNDSNQISDHEAQSDTYRLDGYLVQSYWSDHYKKYLIPDKNQQTVALVPTNTGNFKFQYSLLVQGDQRGPDDVIDIDTFGSAPNQGIQVTLNTEVFRFDAGQLSAITINLGNGNDVVNVEALPANVTLTVNKNGSGMADVDLSPTSQKLATIQGSVLVNGNSQGTAILLYDQAGQVGANYQVGQTQFSCSDSSASLGYQGVSRVYVLAAAGAGVVNVSPQPLTLPMSVTLDGGGATLVVDDRSNFRATAYGLTANALTRSAAGQPLVTVNYSHIAGLTLDTVGGGIMILDASGAALGMNDQANAQATTYAITATGLARTSARLPAVTVNYANLARLGLRTGSGADTVNLESTSGPTSVTGGGGADQFNVGLASHTLSGVGGTLLLDGGSGGAAVIVNDRANPSGLLITPFAQYTVTRNSLTRDVTYPFWKHHSITTISYAHLTSLELDAGDAGPNVIDVESTSVSTDLYPGKATSRTDVSPTRHNLDDVGADLHVWGGPGALNLYDQANPHGAASGVPTVYALDQTGDLSRTATYRPGAQPVVTWISCYLTGLNLYTSTSPNQVAVRGTSGPTIINSGAPDTVTVGDPVLGLQNVNQLTVDAHGGTLTVDDRGTQNDDGGDSFTTWTAHFTITDQAVTRQAHQHDEEVIIPDSSDLPGGGEKPPKPIIQVTDTDMAETIRYRNLGGLRVLGGPVQTSLAVQSTPAGTPVTVQAGEDSSAFSVGAGGSVKNVRSPLTFRGGGSYSSLLLDDSAATAQDKVTVTPAQVGAAAADQFFGVGGGLNYDGFGTLTLFLSTAWDDVAQITPSATTAFALYDSQAALQAGHGARFNVNLTGVTSPVNTPAGPGAGRWTFGNRQPVTYAAAGALADVTAQLTISRGSFTYDPSTGYRLQTVTLMNTGGKPIVGPLSLELDGLSASGPARLARRQPQLANLSGFTQAGSPYPDVDLPGNVLNVGQSVTVTLAFDTALVGGVSYHSRVLAGAG
jgi:hypothetical protein